MPETSDDSFRITPKKKPKDSRVKDTHTPGTSNYLSFTTEKHLDVFEGGINGNQNGGSDS